MTKIIFAAMMVLSLNAFAEVVQMTGTGGRSYATETEVKTLKDACAIANQVAEDQAVNACSVLEGKNQGISHKTVNPVVNLGGRSGSCRISVDINCEVSF